MDINLWQNIGGVAVGVVGAIVAAPALVVGAIPLGVAAASASAYGFIYGTVSGDNKNNPAEEEGNDP